MELFLGKTKKELAMRLLGDRSLAEIVSIDDDAAINILKKMNKSNEVGLASVVRFSKKRQKDEYVYYLK